MPTYRRGGVGGFYLFPVGYSGNPKGENRQNAPHIEMIPVKDQTQLFTQDIDGDLAVITLKDEEMEELFLAWQILKKERNG